MTDAVRVDCVCASTQVHSVLSLVSPDGDVRRVWGPGSIIGDLWDQVANSAEFGAGGVTMHHGAVTTSSATVVASLSGCVAVHLGNHLATVRVPNLNRVALCIIVEEA